MLGEELAGVASNDFNNEINKIIDSMSGAHIDHKSTITTCYAQYFQQKVRAFQEIEKLIGLIIQSYKQITVEGSKMAVIHKEVDTLHTECRFFADKYFTSIQRNGFGLRHFNNSTVSKANHCKPRRVSNFQKLIANAKIKSTTWNGDQFSDFILKDDDNGLRMMGYGVINSERSPATTVKCSNMVDVHKMAKSTNNVDASKKSNLPTKVPPIRISMSTLTTSIAGVNKNAASDRIVHTAKNDTSNVPTSSSFLIKNLVNMEKDSKSGDFRPIIEATTSGTIKRSSKIDKSKVVKRPDEKKTVALVVAKSSNAFRSQSGAVKTQMEIDQENIENSYKNIPPENFKFPMRLRMKRNLAVMTGTENLPDDNNSNSDDKETKRQRQ